MRFDKSSVLKARYLRVFYPYEPRGWYRARVKKICKHSVRVVFEDNTSIKVPKSAYMRSGGGEDFAFQPVHKRKRLTLKEKVDILITQARCNICQRPLEKHSFDFDHCVPLKDGGSNEIHNFQVICVGCHAKKTRKK